MKKEEINNADIKEKVYKYKDSYIGVFEFSSDIASIPDLPMYGYTCQMVPLTDWMKFKNMWVSSFSFNYDNVIVNSVCTGLKIYSLNNIYRFDNKEEVISATIGCGLGVSLKNAKEKCILNYLLYLTIGSKKDLSKIKIIDYNNAIKVPKQLSNFIEQTGYNLSLYLVKNEYNVPIVLFNLYVNELQFIIGFGVGNCYKDAIFMAIDDLGKNINILNIINYNDFTSLFNLTPDECKVVSYDKLGENYNYNPLLLWSKFENDIEDITPNEFKNEIYICKINKSNSISEKIIKHMFSEYYEDFSKLKTIGNGKDITYYSRDYHEVSKLRTIYKMEDFIYNVNKIDKHMKDLSAKACKNYNYFKAIKLVDVKDSRTKSIEEVILYRRSLKKYDPNKAMYFEELSKILYFSYGVTGCLKCEDSDDLMLRAVPSGGGLYPVEVYIIVSNVEGLEKGVYYYNSLENTVVKIKKNEDIDSLTKSCGYPKMIKNAGAIFVLSCLLTRNQWKYQERGYRIMNLDCGHVAQNINLMATSLGLGVCSIMGFVDNDINNFIGLDGINETSMNIVTVGKKKER